MTTSFCTPDTVIPSFENLPIPKNLSVYARPGTSTSLPALKTCCAPNAVQLAESCYLWCQIPDSYFNASKSKEDIMDKFDDCLYNNGIGHNRSISGYRIVSDAARPMPTLQTICVLSLLLMLMG